MKNFLYKFLLIIGVFTISSCEFDQLESPNDVTIGSADINLILNKVQVDFADFVNSTSYRAAAVTRQYHQPSDTYEIAYPATSLNGSWDAYASSLQDIKTIKEIATKGNFKKHLGVAKTLEAYILMGLVDTYGDVPYSQAFDPANFSPGRDKGADVYKAALDLLTSAQADFVDPNSVGTVNDQFYAGSMAKWAKVNNALQLKYHLNRRLIDAAGSKAAIDALIAKNAFPAVGDEFVWRYGTSVNDPFTRHPEFQTIGGGDYQSNFLMWHLTEAKGSDDPRAAYYFYRQVVANPTNASEVRCLDEFAPAHYPTGMPFCLPGTRGYWGRDHLDPQGIPPDGPKRTLYGVYPVGGVFDEGKGGSVGATLQGNVGAGLEPIMLPAYVDFMLAESALELGTAGDAGVLLTSAITKHMNYVRAFSTTGALAVQAAKITAAKSAADFTADVKAYTDKIKAEYDAAADKKAKLNVIAREYWIGSFGAGIESYNLYRRTGLPAGMQPGLVATFGSFPRTFLYPSNHVERNSTEPQKASNKVKVFWDNNPDGFIN
jgi:hypothetical protein